MYSIERASTRFVKMPKIYVDLMFGYFLDLSFPVYAALASKIDREVRPQQSAPDVAPYILQGLLVSQRSQRSIATVVGCNQSTVSRQLRRFIEIGAIKVHQHEAAPVYEFGVFSRDTETGKLSQATYLERLLREYAERADALARATQSSPYLKLNLKARRDIAEAVLQPLVDRLAARERPRQLNIFTQMKTPLVAAGAENYSVVAREMHSCKCPETGVSMIQVEGIFDALRDARAHHPPMRGCITSDLDSAVEAVDLAGEMLSGDVSLRGALLTRQKSLTSVLETPVREKDSMCPVPPPTSVVSDSSADSNLTANFQPVPEPLSQTGQTLVDVRTTQTHDRTHARPHARTHDRTPPPVARPPLPENVTRCVEISGSDGAVTGAAGGLVTKATNADGQQADTRRQEAPGRASESGAAQDTVAQSNARQEPAQAASASLAEAREALRAEVEAAKERSRKAVAEKLEKARARERQRANLDSDAGYRNWKPTIARLERVWRDAMKQHYPAVPQIAWFKSARPGSPVKARKEGQLVADLLDGYGDAALVEAVLVDFVERWESHYLPLLKQQPGSFPTLGLLYACHASVVAEFTRYSQIRSSADAYAQWERENADNPFATPPPHLLEAHKAAQHRQTRRGRKP
jgi:hypothetical protein